MGRALGVVALLTIALSACASDPHSGPGRSLVDCVPRPTLKDVWTCTSGEAETAAAPASEPKPENRPTS